MFMQKRLQNPLISVIIPARNEARNLRYVLPFIPSMVSEVILVDGRSTDNTVEVAQQLLPSIHVIQQHGSGKGDALRLGFVASSGDILVTLDADGSADPGEIPSFVEALVQGYDFAKGSRFMQGGGSRDISFLRRLGNLGLGMMVNVLFRTRFSDLCYGYNAFWRDCLDRIGLDCEGFEVETLINLRMHKARLKIIEIPSFEFPRMHGASKLHTFKDGWRVLKTILRERGSSLTRVDAIHRATTAAEGEREELRPYMTTMYGEPGQMATPEEGVDALNRTAAEEDTVNCAPAVTRRALNRVQR